MTTPKRILYRGVPMIEGWPEKIIAAQEIVSLKLQGRDIPRIRYGKEQSDWNVANTPCHDCRVLVGEFHVPSCDVEECPVCGGQLISCDCEFDDAAQAPD
jgi:rRNA maturation endonuclease Nob1